MTIDKKLDLLAYKIVYVLADLKERVMAHFSRKKSGQDTVKHAIALPSS